LGRSIKKYLRKNVPSRPESGSPQEMHAIGLVGPVEASMRVRQYFAPQVGQRNVGVFCIGRVWRSAASKSNKTPNSRFSVLKIDREKQVAWKKTGTKLT
jgi:hypothetical protein